jgi:hypothetical protein
METALTFTSTLTDSIRAHAEYLADQHMRRTTTIYVRLLDICTTLFRETIVDLSKNECNGCKHGHGSQKNHTCQLNWGEQVDQHFEDAYQLVTDIAIFGTFVTQAHSIGLNVYLPHEVNTFKTEYKSQIRAKTGVEILLGEDDDSMGDVSTDDDLPSIIGISP